MTEQHSDTHKPEWRMGRRAYCDTCGHKAATFKCADCNELADEATVAHGNFGYEVHTPKRKANQCALA
jgi:hypothetical protein